MDWHRKVDPVNVNAKRPADPHLGGQAPAFDLFGAKL